MFYHMRKDQGVLMIISAQEKMNDFFNFRIKIQISRNFYLPHGPMHCPNAMHWAVR